MKLKIKVMYQAWTVYFYFSFVTISGNVKLVIKLIYEIENKKKEKGKHW